jgi:hypothetical protein
MYRSKGLCYHCGKVKAVGRCEACRNKNKQFNDKRTWWVHIISDSRRCDKLKGFDVSSDYIDAEYLKSTRQKQHNGCGYCGIKMKDKNRKAPDGLTVERLDNFKPHTKENCILVCHHCNVTQPRPNYPKNRRS